MDNVRDYQVKYGATYCYKISTIYLLRWSEYGTDSEGSIYSTQKYSLVKSRSAPKVTIECVEKIPPNPPMSLMFGRHSDESITLFWNPPSNPQMDLAKYQVFRRDSIEDSYVLQMEIDFDQTEDQVASSEDIPEQFIAKSDYPITSF